MKANETQVGGLHYRSAFQHWDLVALYGLGYFEGQITKYTARHAKKHKAQDVDKAIHFTEKLVELFQAAMYSPTHVTFMPGKSAEYHGMAPSVYFARVNNIGTHEEIVVQIMCQWQSLKDLKRLQSLLQTIRHRYVMEAARAEEHQEQRDGVSPGTGYVSQDPDDILPHKGFTRDPGMDGMLPTGRDDMQQFGTPGEEH